MRKTVYKSLGFLFLVLAIIGVLLPVVPATPFGLLAAWFFARSSEKWHRRLLANALLGPVIRNWEDNRCISRRTKIIAVIMMVSMGGSSILFAVDDFRIQLVTLGLMALGCATLLSLKTCPEH